MAAWDYPSAKEQPTGPRINFRGPILILGLINNFKFVTGVRSWARTPGFIGPLIHLRQDRTAQALPVVPVRGEPLVYGFATGVTTEDIYTP